MRDCTLTHLLAHTRMYIMRCAAPLLSLAPPHLLLAAGCPLWMYNRDQGTAAVCNYYLEGCCSARAGRPAQPHRPKCQLTHDRNTPRHIIQPSSENTAG